MQPGDVFSLDNDAIVDMENKGFSVVWVEVPDKDKPKEKVIHRLTPGIEFRITSTGLKGLPVEIRASKMDAASGKAIRGRPRRFPPAIVARLLGETWTPSAPTPDTKADDLSAPTAVASSIQASTDATPTVDEIPEVEEVEESTEDKEARAARIANLLGLGGDQSTTADW